MTDTSNYIIPEVPADTVVEVPGVGLMRNDLSERLSEHPRQEDQVTTQDQIAAAMETLESLHKPELAALLGVEPESMTKPQMIKALKLTVSPEPVKVLDIINLSKLPVPQPVEAELETADEPAEPEVTPNA